MSDIKFIIDPEHRVVVCKLLNCENTATGRIYKYMKSTEMFELWNNYTIKSVYTGVARCAPEDEWNEEYGKRLALKRAKKKRGDDANRMIMKWHKRVSKELDNLVKYGIHRTIEEV